ncbi:SMP-30/gluconolactonase/LRE family protein [uncultured Gimesia sp.]|jgi:gluconolactonase|uniref:SMP-30/gluconolactonase/LRE family protein n=1 Tax=uncultured Gimesia sp. TaxID=1678688 RepID=UPI0026207B9C|nr:SMP-30/gluconolactonase/LRE family protein [uncultured Gimesia sp.]
MSSQPTGYDRFANRNSREEPTMIHWQHLFVLGMAFSGFAGSMVYAATPAPSGDASIVSPESKVEELWVDKGFTEGACVDVDGIIYFSDINFAGGLGKIMAFDPATGKTTVFSADSGQSNGLMIDQKGKMLAACGANNGKQCLAQISKKGKVKCLIDNFEGKKFNAPNDLVVHPQGWVYFTDPRYVGTEPLELDHMSVYRYDPKTKTVHRATTDISKPNGTVVSPDGKTLYVAETDNGATGLEQDPPKDPKKRMTLNAFPIQEDGALGKKTVLADFGGKETGIDGMTVDQKGNIYTAFRAESRFGIVVFSPEGKELAYIPTPTTPTNCTFGIGDDASTLYITAGSGLYRIPCKIPGFHPSLPVKQ